MLYMKTSKFSILPINSSPLKRRAKLQDPRNTIATRVTQHEKGLRIESAATKKCKQILHT